MRENKGQKNPKTDRFHAVINMCLHWSLYHQDNWEKWGRAKDFLDHLTDLSLIYLATDNLSFGITEKLNFSHAYMKEEIIPPPQMPLRHL